MNIHAVEYWSLALNWIGDRDPGHALALVNYFCVYNWYIQNTFYYYVVEAGQPATGG